MFSHMESLNTGGVQAVNTTHYFTAKCLSYASIIMAELPSWETVVLQSQRHAVNEVVMFRVFMLGTCFNETNNTVALEKGCNHLKLCKTKRGANMCCAQGCRIVSRFSLRFFVFMIEADISPA